MKRPERIPIFHLLWWLLVYAAAFLLCTRIPYSDGDDAFFIAETADRSLFAFVSWRYENWSGRVAAEAFLYLIFRTPVAVWRILNALMLTLLPFLTSRLLGYKPEANKAGYVRAGFFPAIFFTLSYLLHHPRTLGYACLWMTGSVNYLWCAVFCVAALFALKPLWDQKKEGSRVIYVLTSLCAVLCVTGSEQFGLILLVPECMGLLFAFRTRHAVRFPLLVQTVLSLAAFAFSLSAPGNAQRTADAVALCFPDFYTRGFSKRLFLTHHYLLSACAKELSLILALLLIAVAIRFYLSGVSSVMRRAAVVPLLLGISEILSRCGIPCFSDTGLSLPGLQSGFAPDITWNTLSVTQRFACCWQLFILLALVLFLFFFLPDKRNTLLLCLIALCSVAMMGFSPTIYWSGERVLFPAGLLFTAAAFIIVSGDNRRHEIDSTEIRPEVL